MSDDQSERTMGTEFRPTRYTAIDLKQEDGIWHATQTDVDIIGRGDNPARAVARYAESVAETVYEAGEGQDREATAHGD